MTTEPVTPAAANGHGRQRALLLVDDHPVFRSGMAALIARAGLGVQVHEAPSVPAAMDVLATHHEIGLILYDWHLPGGGGVRGLISLIQFAPGVAIVVVSGDEDEAIRIAARQVGAIDCVPKSTDARTLQAMLAAWLARAAGARARNGLAEAHPCPALTVRQEQVLRLLSLGLANKRIAEQLGIVEPTVRTHVSEILKALGAHNRTEAVVRAGRLGLIEADAFAARAP